MTRHHHHRPSSQPAQRPAGAVYRFKVQASTGEDLGTITVKASDLHGRTPQQVANSAIADQHREAFAFPR